MDPQVRCIQPGGGVVCRLELAWGYWRRFWLKTFRPGYVRRMAATRKGTVNGCPHEVIDPRDVKFFRNQDGYHWAPADDPFRWRDRIPFARWGLAELMVFSPLTFGPAVVLAWLLASEPVLAAQVAGWLVVATLMVFGLLVVWFFRDPPRRIPGEPGLVVSPADGKVVAIDEIAHDEFLGGPAIRIGIFSVDLQRPRQPTRHGGGAGDRGAVPARASILNALRPESARENEQIEVRIKGGDGRPVPPLRRPPRSLGPSPAASSAVLKPGDD